MLMLALFCTSRFSASSNLICIFIYLQGSESKLRQMIELAGKSRGNVVTLDDSTIAYFAQQKPVMPSAVPRSTAKASLSGSLMIAVQQQLREPP